MNIISFVIVGLLSVLGVSSLVEFYKKTIRKDQSKKWENWLVGAVLSIGFSALICLKGLAYPFFGNMLLNIAVYAVVIFLLQMFIDMKFVKKIIASALEHADIEKLIPTIIEKLGISMDKVRSILKSLNITAAKLKKALADAGISEAVIEKIIAILYPVKESEKKEEAEKKGEVKSEWFDLDKLPLIRGNFFCPNLR